MKLLEKRKKIDVWIDIAIVILSTSLVHYDVYQKCTDSKMFSGTSKLR